MFCSKCGNQIPDGSAFCASCGTPVGGTANNGAAKNSSSEMPPIITSLVSKTVKFFTGNGQVDVVARAAQDKTWSGAILAAIGVLLFPLTQLLNMKAFLRGYLMMGSGGDVSYSDASKYAGNLMEYGATFGYSILFAVLYAVALAAMTFAMGKMCKKNITFVSAVNIAAYASLPVIAICILNLLFGFIWGILPAMLFLAAMVMSLGLIYQGMNKAYGLDNSFLPFACLATVMTVLTTACGYMLFVGVVNA